MTKALLKVAKLIIVYYFRIPTPGNLPSIPQQLRNKMPKETILCREHGQIHKNDKLNSQIKIKDY